MKNQKFFTWLVLAAAVVCLAVFAWADSKQVNATTIRVDTSADLIAAVNNNTYSIIEISKDANITMTTSLSIPAGRTVTLSLDEGSSLDFSDLTETDGDYVGICNEGDLTIAGSGDIVMSKDNGCILLVDCSGDATLDVTGGTLSAHSSGSESSANAIFAVDSATVTVTGGTLSAHGSNDSFACAIYAGDSATVTVTGGTLSAHGSNDSPACAIYAGESATVTLLSGDFTGKLGESDKLNGSLHGGKYKNDESTLTTAMIAPGCTKSGDYIINCAKLKLSVGGVELGTSGDEYKCTVGNTQGSKQTITAALTSGDSSAELTSLDVIDKAALPKSLDVTTSSTDKKITVTNNGCAEGTYKVTIVAGNTSNNQAFRTLNIIVEATEAVVSTQASLDEALRSTKIKKITLADDISSFASFDNLGRAKSLDLNGKTLTLTKSANVSKDLLVSGGTLTIAGDTVFGTITGCTLTISGDAIVNGTAFADGITSADVTINNGAKFSESTSVESLLKDDQYITSYKDGDYYTVKALSELESAATAQNLAEALYQQKVTGITVGAEITGQVKTDVNLNGTGVKLLNLNGYSVGDACLNITGGVTLEIKGASANGGMTATGDNVLFTAAANTSALSIDNGIFKSDNGNYFSGGSSANVTIASQVKFYGTEEPANVKSVLQENQMLKPVPIESEQYWEVILKSESPDVTVGTSASLDLAVRDDHVKNISLACDIADAEGFKLTSDRGSKKIDLETKTLSLDGGITITDGMSLDVLDGTLATTHDGYMFTISDDAKLVLESGTFRSSNKKYITGGTSANVIIANGVKFFGSYNELKDEINPILGKEQVLEEGTDGYCTVRKLDPKEPAVTKPETLKKSLESDTVTTVQISGDVEVTESMTISGTKTLVVSNDNTMTMDNSLIIVPAETSLDVYVYSGAISADNGPIFKVEPQGVLRIETGRLFSKNHKYFCGSEYTPNNTPLSTPNAETEIGEIEITNGTLFYFGDDNQDEVNDFVSKYLAANNQTLEKADDGYWKVTDAPKSSSSSSGCNAGFAALALLGLAAIPFKKKK